jgi:Ca2+-binding RTX toxin-like protein
VVITDGGAIEVNGGTGRDRIRTGAFADRVNGGGGADSIDTGSGDDVVRSRDGRRDRVRCGDGVDTVDADAIDLLGGCEVIEPQRRSRIG